MKNNLIVMRPPHPDDKTIFLNAMAASQSLHHPWVSPPLTSQAFDEYIERYKQENQQSYLIFDNHNNLVGVFNLNEIVRGVFQNAFLGFYAVADFAHKGLMSEGLKLILKHAFQDIGLHRIEANIQPNNIRSINFIKKSGFRYEGFSPRYLKINGEWCSHEHWVITAEDYLQNYSNNVVKARVNTSIKQPTRLNYNIISIEEKHIDEFWHAVDSVSRENKYLAFLEGPPIQTTKDFVLQNIKENWPHLVAIHNKKVIGWCDITSLNRPIFAHSGSLGIGVLAPFRGQGIGKALMIAAIQQAKLKGLTRIELTVRENNINAIALYKKLGFEKEGIHINSVCVDGKYENLISMALLLPK